MKGQPSGHNPKSASGATPTDFTFTGQRNEAGFGLMDYNARYYNPRLGRFISPDTIVPEPGGSQGWNRYAYVRNSPLKYTDPSGHSWEPRHCLVCTVKIDVSDWPNWAKKAGGFIGGATIGGGYDPEQDAIVGPTPEEWVESALMDMGSPAPLSAVTKTGGKVLKEVGEEVLDEAGETLGRKAVQETPHAVSGSRPPNGGRTGEPNSIWEQIRDDGSRSVTYFDEQGRRFSREDYGQRSPHGSLGQDASGRTVPHEHRYNYSDQGPTGKQYRELDENDRPISDWFDD